MVVRYVNGLRLAVDATKRAGITDAKSEELEQRCARALERLAVFQPACDGKGARLLGPRLAEVRRIDALAVEGKDTEAVDPLEAVVADLDTGDAWQ